MLCLPVLGAQRRPVSRAAAASCPGTEALLVLQYGLRWSELKSYVPNERERAQWSEEKSPDVTKNFVPEVLQAK